MAKITWDTVYSTVEVNGGSGETYHEVFTGSFKLIRFGGFVSGTLFFYEPTNGWLIPVTQVLKAQT